MSAVARAERADTFPEQRITISQAERVAGVLSAENMALATVILSCRGYVILAGVLEPTFVETIRKEVSDIYDDCLASMGDETSTDPDASPKVEVSNRKAATFWYRKSRWRIFPRLAMPMSDPRLLANSFVTPILERLLGEDFYCKYFSSDTCVKGAILQSPHSDIDGDDIIVDNAWQPRGYIVNVPIMECGLHNGPLEVWPGGSHMWSSTLTKKHALSPNVQDGRNPAVERVAEYFPSTKVVLVPGEILIRDLAMWHRGTPNPTEHPRTMLTIAFFRRDRAYGYGDPSYNVDADTFAALQPRIQKMFDYHFTVASRLRRTRKHLRKAAGQIARSLGNRLRTRT